MRYFNFELSQQNLNFLLTLLSSLQILDIAIAISLYFIYKKDHHYFNAIFLWIGMFMFFATDSLLGSASNNHPLLSFSFVLLTGFNISNLIRKLYKIEKKHNYIFTLAMIFLTIIFRVLTPDNFTLIAFPISLSITGPIFTALYLAIKNIKKNVIKTSIVDYLFISVSFLWGLHFIDYPFLREHENLHFSFFGFSFALVLTYLFSILIPVVINRRIYLNINELIKSELEIRSRELAKAQSLLYKQDKLASMGNLVAGVAHEIKNPLNIINTSNHYMKNFSKKYDFEKLREIFTSGDQNKLEKLKKDRERFTETNTVITTSIKRADQVIQSMLGHARGDESKILEPTNTNELIRETAILIEKSIKSRDKILMQLDLDETIQITNTYMNDLRRVIINMLENSIYSIQEKRKNHKGHMGEIKITTKNLKDKRMLQIKISDNGLGVPNDISRRIFDPFMTTKPTGQGTGLGLSISHDIIKEHLGDIEIVTKNQSGATFIITISTSL